MPRASKKEIKEKTSEKQGIDNALDDERRLFYVALTRAKESVTVTYAREDMQHRETVPSEFIGEIRGTLIEDIDAKDWDRQAKNDRAFQFAPLQTEAQSKGATIKDEAFVRELFDRQGLSATALNNYLECPWKYFYQNLIRIPTVQTVHQLYGMAVHATLQDFFKRSIVEEVDKNFLLESFKGHLYRQPIAPRDADSLLNKGVKALSGWFDTYEGSWNMHLITEYRITGVVLGDIKLTGVLDKLEFNDDDTVDVIDYKTARPKTRNDILGKTLSSDGNYFRQLTFYKLLLDNFADGKFTMNCAVIDFIEPDEKGKYHKESFEIGQSDIVELSSTIYRVADEIRTLKFWDEECDDKNCEWCGIRRLLKK